MRNAFFVLVCLIPILACNLANQNNTSQNRIDETRPTPAFSTNSEANVTNTNTAAPKSDLIARLKKTAGNYPEDIRLLDDPDLSNRLSKLLGKDYGDMKKYWNVETPVEIKQGKLKTTGCEQHNCGANQYVMFVDLENDNINVYHLNDEGGTKTYFEKGKIQLPPDFASEVQTADK